LLYSSVYKALVRGVIQLRSDSLTQGSQPDARYSQQQAELKAAAQQQGRACHHMHGGYGLLVRVLWLVYWGCGEAVTMYTVEQSNALYLI
jgi:hypothetical protein